MLNKYFNLPKRDNIQGFWRLEETSGTIRYDSSTNGNNLGASNSPTYDIGKIGNCVKLASASKQYLSINDGDQTGLDITGHLTLAAWIKTSSTAAQIIVSKCDKTGTQRGYMLQLDANNKLMFCEAPNSDTLVTITSTSALSTNTWYHCLGTYDGSYLKVYINGQSAANPVSYNQGSYNNTNPFRIGAYYGDASYFNGLIDEVIVWNTYLTDTEVSHLYNITSYMMFRKNGVAIGSPMIF